MDVTEGPADGHGPPPTPAPTTGSRSLRALARSADVGMSPDGAQSTEGSGGVSVVGRAAAPDRLDPDA